MQSSGGLRASWRKLQEFILENLRGLAQVLRAILVPW
jgi:hypothetical protein